MGYAVIGLDRIGPEPGTIWLDQGQLQADKAPVAKLLQIDLADESQIEQLPDRLRRELAIDRCHCLVNNAGVVDPYFARRDPGAPERRKAWRTYIDVNLTGAFLLSEVLAPMMPPGDASIIHITSTRAHQSEPHCEGYAAAKAGLVGLTHAQAASLAGTARVNCICLGWIDTSGDPGSLRHEDHAWHWTGSVGRPEDVAEMVAFLADGSKSQFVTGQQFVVDGGVSKRMVYPE